MSLDLSPYYADQGMERVTHDLDGRQVWRQIGWIGVARHKIYPLGADHDDPAGVAPVWWLVEDEPPVSPDPSVPTT